MQDKALPDRFIDHVRSQHLFPEPGRALVAVSGGADSLALLYLLVDTCGSLGVELVVGHVDHGIASASATWARRVKEVGEQLALPVVTVRLELGPRASETVARRARYDALRRMQRARDARYLVTAHHADDQIETVLQRFIRGSGPAGLAGIAARASAGLVRPLLPFHRDELTQWLAGRVPDLVPIDDPANRDERHDRVWIRSRLLPPLRDRFGEGLEHRLLTATAHARTERDAWAALLTELTGLEYRVEAGAVEVARVGLRAYDETLCAVLLRAAAREAGCVIGLTKAHRLVRFVREAKSGRAMQLGGGWVAETVFERLRIHRPAVGSLSAHPHPHPHPHPYPYAYPRVEWGTGETGDVTWGTWHISWRPDPAGPARRDALTTWALPGKGVVRCRCPGDTMAPHGGVGHRKVRRLMMEARVPRGERDAYPLVTRGDDILWIPGICRSEASLPRPGEPAVRLDAHRR